MLYISKGVVVSLISSCLFVTSGCSSEPETPEEVAMYFCSAFKNGNIDDMFLYMNEELKEETGPFKNGFVEDFKSKDFKDKYQLPLDCEHPTKSNLFSSGKKFQAYFGKNVKIKLIKSTAEKWQVYKFDFG